MLVPASWSLLIYSLKILFPSLKSVPTSFYRKALIPSSKLETERPAALRAPGRGAGWAAGPDRKRRGLPTGRAAATSPALGDVSLGGARLRTSCTAAFPQPVAGRLKHACGVWCVVLRWPVGAGVPAAGPQERPVSQQRTSGGGHLLTASRAAAPSRCCPHVSRLLGQLSAAGLLAHLGHWESERGGRG